MATLPNWTLMTDSDVTIRRWRHTDYDIWMTVSHQPDHYPRDEEEHAHEDEYDQVMRWHARVTLGKNITVGVNQISICQSSCAEAEAEVMNWAQNWMNSEFQSWIESYDDSDSWRE